MKAARVEKLISAIDIGSSKVSALIAGQTDSGELLVLGTGQRESRGVTRGCIADIEQAELSVRHAVEQAERIAGINIDRVWVGMSSGGLDSLLAPVEIELGGDRITQEDVDQLLQAGRANIHSGGKMPLHIQPTLYSLDGVGGVANPVGLHADRLGVDIHVVLADQSPVRNIDMTARAAHLDVESVVVAPVATGLACLTAEERELGVALVEFGAAITNVSVFIGGMLVGLETIQKGASDITDDIASTFGIRRAQAERLKCFHGSALTSPRDHQEVLEVGPDENGNEAGAACAAHHQGAAECRGLPARRRYRDRNRAGIKGARFFRPIQPPGGSDRRRGGIERHSRTYARRAWPDGPDRPPIGPKRYSRCPCRACLFDAGRT